MTDPARADCRCYAKRKPVGAVVFPRPSAIVAGGPAGCRCPHPTTRMEATMSLQVLLPEPAAPADGRLDYARQVLRAEAAGLELVARRLDDSFLRAVDLLLRVTAEAPAASPSPAPASPPTSARKSPAPSTRPAPAPTSSTPPRPSTATSAWSTPTTSCWCCPTAARARKSSACCGPLRPLAQGADRPDRQRRQHAGPQGRRGHRVRPAGRGLSRSAWRPAPAPRP